MYFSDANGFMEYDAVTWKRNRNDQLGTVRSFVIDGDERIYIGSTAEIGYFKKDSLKNWDYESLTHLVPEEHRVFNDIWRVVRAGDYMYYQSRERLFRISTLATDPADDWDLRVWSPTNSFFYCFYEGGEFYVHEGGKGLLKMVNDELQLIPGSEFLGADRLQIMIPFHNSTDKYLLGSFRSGFFIMEDESFRPFDSPINEISKDFIAYKGLQFGKDQFVLACIGTGLVVIDTAGNVVQQINKSNGFQNDAAYALTLDKNQVVWAGLDNGISRVDISSPINVYDEDQGILSSVLAIRRFEGKLYLGTSSGLLVQNNQTGNFEPINEIPNNQIFDLQIIDDNLFVTSQGLYGLKNGRITLVKDQILGEFNAATVFQSKLRPEYLYVGMNTGVGVFRKRDDNSKNLNNWRYLGKMPEITESIRNFDESEDGVLWVGSQNVSVYKIENLQHETPSKFFDQAQITEYSSEQGLEGGSFLFPYYVEDRLYVVDDQGNFMYDPESDRFYRDTILVGPGKYIDTDLGPEDFNGLQPEGEEKIWAFWNGNIGEGEKQEDGTFKIDYQPFRILTDERPNTLYPDENNLVWLNSLSGIIRYDRNKARFLVTA